jgi:hypothetical protein
MVGTRNRRMSTDARGQIPESAPGAQVQIWGQFGGAARAFQPVEKANHGLESPCHLLDPT